MEEAVKKAGQEWNSTYADKLEKLLAKRAITVNLGFNTRNLNNLDDVKRRLAELKITPLTPENKKVIKDLVRDLKELARIMEKIQKFKGGELPELQMAKAAKLRKDVEQADEKLRLSQERVRLSQERFTLSQQRAANQAKATGRAYGEQSGYLERLIRRMVVYGSIHQVGNFLAKIREVTAEFELQRVSLGAIIQDQYKANALFSEIKSFALKSPVSIMDLTKYTKQLAAYKVGFDGVKTDTKELFDWTKKLTDVSVGLGVSMDRVVLAFGQVRATGYLRASEVRQFTEMGVPIVEELATKLTDMNGKLVTSADVMEMISKRAISFDMVKDVFTDMTSAGGMFYNMQEKQGNTLFGLWAKLGDAASVMYDEIGNTELVNDAMKWLIQLATDLMRNWDKVAMTVIPAMAALAGVSIVKKGIAAWHAFTASRLQGARRLVTATTNLRNAEKFEAQATEELAAARAGGVKMDIQAAQAKLKLAQANLREAQSERAAAAATGVLAKSMRVLKTVLSSNIFWVAASALGGLIASLATAKTETEELDAALTEADRKVANKNASDIAKFKGLADEILKSVDGSEKQRKAIEELGRTFDGVIDKQFLTAEGLRKLNGDYEEFYEQIKAGNEEMRRSEKIAAVENMYGPKIKEYTDNLIDIAGENSAMMSELLLKIQDEVNKGEEVSFGRAMELAQQTGLIEQEGLELWSEFNKLTGGNQIEASLYDKISLGPLVKYIDAVKQEAEAIKKVNAEVDANIANLNKYKSEMDKLAELISAYEILPPETKFGVGLELYTKEDAIAKLREMQNAVRMFGEEWLALEEKIISIGSYEVMPKELAGDEYAQLLYKRNQDMLMVVNKIKDQIRDSGLTLTDELDKSFFHVVEKFDKDTGDVTHIYMDNLIDWLREQGKSQLVSAVKDARENIVDAIAPDSELVSSTQRRFMELNRGVHLGFGTLNQLLMKNGEDIEKYRKRLDEEIKNYQKTLFKLSLQKKWAKLWGKPTEAIAKDIKEATEAMKAANKMLNELGGSIDNNRGTKSDPRPQILNEMVQLAEKLNKEYSDWEKKVGSTKALEKVNDTYAETVKYAEKVAKDAGITLPHLKTPTNAKELNEYLEAVRKVMESAKGLKGGKKAAIELAVKMSNNVSAEDQKAIEEKIKALSDSISRTKTAKEFYEKILRLTRNEDLAFRATFSVFGQDKLDTFNDEIDLLKQNFGEIDITAAINLSTKQIDYKALREIWEADKARPDNLRKIPQAYDSAIKSILDAGDKLSERQFERWGKDLERAREYADKRIELAQYTATQIAEIEAKRDSLKPDSKGYEQQRTMYNEMLRGYREREKNEAAKLDYEQIKEQIGVFDDLGVRIGTAFESILTQLREYTKSPDFSRLGLEAQKNVYQQIAKIEDRMAEGFQSIGIGTVSEYVRQYSTAASEYLTAQNNLREATLKAIEADKEWERVKNSNDEAAKSAALAEKTLADSRVRTAAASVNAAGANLQRAQEGAARASAKFDSNLQKVESSLKSLNNGALKALWDLIGDKGKRSVGEFLSGSRKILSALDKLTKALADSGSDMGQLSTTIAANLATALENINPDDTEAITRAATESLKTTLSSVISDKGVVDLLANTLSKNIGEIASQALSGVLSTEDAANKVGALIDGVADAASKTGEMWGAIISLVLSLLDEFAENGIGTFLGELLDNIADAVEGILANLLTDSLPKILGSVGNVVKGVGVGLTDMLTFGAFDLTGAKRIKKANKEIKRQQELLEQLDYTYGRLEKAADKAFGRDYVNNYNQQLKNLQAQQQAYLKQAEAERSKGKKKDEEKIKEYEEQARETADKIKELQDDLVAHFTGSSKTDVARQMAKSWVDARASMSDTFAAIKGDYQDLIKNMIVEGAAARVIENALTPVWDSMDKMLEKNDVQGAIDSLIGGMDAALTQANNGMEVLWKALEARGYDMKKLISDTDASGSEYSGIAKSVAGATSEEINNVAAIGNTLMYYASPIPRIDENLARVVAIMEGKTAALPTASGGTTGAIDYTDMFATANQHLSSLPRMEQHLSEIHTILGRIITTKGGRFGVKIYM